MIVPTVTSDEGSIQVFMSAETQNYEAPIVSASVIGGSEAKVKGGIIDGLKFEKDQPLRIKVQLDFHDYCSVEVKSYAVKK